MIFKTIFSSIKKEPGGSDIFVIVAVHSVVKKSLVYSSTSAANS